MNPHKKGLIFAGTTALCWAVLALMLKYALGFADPFTIAWFRLNFAGLFLLAYLIPFRPKYLRDLKKGIPSLSLVSGIMLAANYFGYLTCIDKTTASNAQVMIQLGPLLLLLAGVFHFKETLAWKQWLGVLIALMGFALFFWDQALVSLENLEVYTEGNMWIMFAAITWAAYAVFHKKLILKGWAPQQLNLILYIVASLALLPFVNFPALQELSLWQISLLLLLGLNTLIAYGCLGEALKLAPASQVSLIITVNPLVTIFLFELMFQLNWNFLAPEPLAWRGYLGAALVVFGVGRAVSRKNA